MNPLLLSLGGGLLGSFFGRPKTQLPPELRQIYQFLMARAQEASDFGHSAPLSNWQERAALAQDKALSANVLNNRREQGYAAMSRADMQNPGQLGDFLSRIGGQEAGQLMNIDTSHMLAALSNRQNALYQEAPGIAASAIGAASGPREQVGGFGDIGGLFAQMASASAYQQSRRRPRSSSAPSVNPLASMAEGTGATGYQAGGPSDLTAPIGGVDSHPFAQFQSFFG